MTTQLTNRVKDYNKWRKSIESQLKVYDMHLCENAIFKGCTPYTSYMGKIEDYETIIEKAKKANAKSVNNSL